MKPGDIQLGNASLHIGYPQCVPGNQRGHIREITRFYVPEEFRGKGEGTALLQDVCEQADIKQLALMLIADTERLLLYYGTFGFELIQPTPMIMLRLPQGYKLDRGIQ